MPYVHFCTNPAGRSRRAETSDMRSFSDKQLLLPDGRQLTYRHWEGTGTPLVLLHGLLDSCAGWDEFAQVTHRPVFAFDLPGFGGSDRPSQPRVQSYANDLEFATDWLDLDHYVLVGHSLGGAVAAHLAESDPEHCAALCLLAPAGFGRQMIAETVALPLVRHATKLSLPLWLSAGPVSGLTYRLMVSNGTRMNPKLSKRLRASARTCAAGAAMATEAIAHAGRAPDALHHRRVAYSGPVSGVWGQRDMLVPASQRYGVRRAFPHATLHVWPDMGHHPQVERPRQLAALIERTAGKARQRRRHLHRPATRPAVA
jgi:pimeloyl-ACP methyl ester carboxylesterase